MAWSSTCTNHYHAQLGLPDHGRAIKGLVVCGFIAVIIYEGDGS